MNWKWIGGALLVMAPLLNGCAANESGPSLGNLGRNFADDWTGARSFDKATADLGRGGPQAMKRVEQAGRALDARINGGSRGSLKVAEAWMNARFLDGARSDASVQYLEAGPVWAQTRREANRSYRAALAFLPSDAKKWRDLDPQLLNALGYFLADRGQNRADFERGLKLTSLALELTPANNSYDRYYRAQGPGDSRAWALFRLGRTAEALKAQAEVIDIAGEESGKYGPPSAEVIYHWGAICRVAGQEEAARDAFKYALTQNPTPELRQLLEDNLSGNLV